MSEKTNQEEREYTPQEIRQMQEKTIAYYKSQEKVLAVQCSVEEYKARIKKAQFEAFDYSMRMMQINQAMQDAAEEEEEAEKKVAENAQANESVLTKEE
jgi:hypothetical protein